MAGAVISEAAELRADGAQVVGIGQAGQLAERIRDQRAGGAVGERTRHLQVVGAVTPGGCSPCGLARCSQAPGRIIFIGEGAQPGSVIDCRLPSDYSCS